MARAGWTTVAVSKATIDAIREVTPYANISSFAREAIQEKLDKLTLVATVSPEGVTTPTKLTTLGHGSKKRGK